MQFDFYNQPVTVRLSNGVHVLCLYDFKRDHWRLFVDKGEFGWVTEEAIRYQGAIPAIERMYEKFMAKLEKQKGDKDDERKSGKDRGAAQGGGEAEASAEAARGSEAGEGPDSGTREGEGSEQGVIAAWRGWRMGRGELLTMRGDAGAWDPYEVNESVCLRMIAARYYRDHHAPDALCQCGYWGYRSYEEMQKHGPALNVYGVVALGGKVQHHRYGFRAQYGRIVALIDSEDSRKLREKWEKWQRDGFRQVFNRGKPRWVRDETLPDGKFPPLLSVAECELLALDEGARFEPDPPPSYFSTSTPTADPPVTSSAGLMPTNITPAATLGQYLILSGGVDPSLNPQWARENKRNVAFVFAPPDKPPHGAMRIDTFLRHDASDRLDINFYGETVTLVKSRIRLSEINGYATLWRLETGLMERDIAVAKAFEKYGREWLKGYAVK